MPALEPQYLAILKQALSARFVPFLPPLLGNVNSADHAAKQLSRVFSAFVLHKLLGLAPKVKESEQFKQDEAQSFCTGFDCC